jgi:hypothetical protein
MTGSRKNHFCLYVFVTTAVLLLPIVASRDTYASDSRYVKVQGLPFGHVLWIHSEPSGSSERIGFLPYSARHIQNYGCKRSVTDWCQVIYRGTRGWVRERYLADDKARRA